MSVEDYWKMVLNLDKEKTKQKSFPNLASCIQVLFSQPCSNASSERAFSVMGSIKIDIRNRLCNVTIASLMRITNWMKSEVVTADTALISDELINCVAKVKANICYSLSGSGDSVSQPGLNYTIN
jgi:hypothetical protein